MIQTYKYKSKFANIIVFAAGLITYMGKDGLATIIPVQYANCIPIIVLIAGYIAVQSTENTRVEVAEQMAVEEFQNNNPASNNTAGEYDGT